MEGRRGVIIEDGRGERGFGGGEEVGEALEDGHLVDEFVDVGDVGFDGEADSDEERVADWLIFWW